MRRDRLLAVDGDRPGRRLAPGKRAQERRLAVADDAGDAHDLALAGRERDVREAVSAQSCDAQDGRLAVDRTVLRREGRLERAPDDHREEIGVGDVRDRGCPAERAVSQDRDAIGDLAHLAETMRDVDDRRSLCRELADGGEQQLDGVLRERCRRLVEDQQPRRHGEGLGEFEQVAARDAQRGDAVLEMALAKCTSSSSDRIAFRDVGIAALEMIAAHCDEDVLGDRHVGQERRMLMDDRDPEILRRAGVRLSTGVPLKMIVPPSGDVVPEATFIRVDLPAPFSPSRACTSPGSTSNETSLSAAIAS